MSRQLSLIVYGIALLFFGLFLFYPIWQTVQGAFQDSQGKFTFDWIVAVFQRAEYRAGLANAFAIAVYSTLLSLAIALPLAILSDKFRFPGKAALSSLVLVPLIMPPFVGAIGVRHLMGQAGALNSFLIELGMMDAERPVDWLGEGQLIGVVIMNALHLYPIIYLNLVAALANVDPAMEEAAQNLGCPPWKRLWKITLPLVTPGLFAGCTIVFIWAFTELGVPLMFDYQTVTSVQIFHLIKDLEGNSMPYALVTVLLASTTVMYLTGKFLFGRQSFAASGRAATASSERELPPVLGWCCAAAFGLVTFIAVLPHLGVVLLSLATDWYGTVLPAELTLQHYRDALGHPLTVPSIWKSLKYATLSTFVDVVLGVGIAYLIVRTRLPGRAILDAVAMLPLAVPGLVLAFGYLSMTREGEPFAWMMLGDDPILLLVIAYAVRRLPYVVRSAAAGYQQTSVSLEEAAQNLGCPPARALWKITIPLIAANLIAGGLLAFSFAMLEVSDSLILAQQAEHYPITKAIYTLFSALGNGHSLAAALGVWGMIFLAVTIVGATLVLGKKLGALFRV